MMRKSYFLGLLLVALLLFDLGMSFGLRNRSIGWQEDVEHMRIAVRQLGLTDLVVTTEARYTRHPAISDSVVPFMDHPDDIEHFPSGTFFRPVPRFVPGRNEP
ncbi:MAG: hypothetical protein ABR512_07130 [Desulfopila sp.]